MTSTKGLKVASDVMFLVALVLVVVGVATGATWAYVAAAFCALDSVVLTVLKRRTDSGRKTG